MDCLIHKIEINSNNREGVVYLHPVTAFIEFTIIGKPSNEDQFVECFSTG